MKKINPEEIERRLRRLKEDKYTGPDRKYPKIILECGYENRIKEKKIPKIYKIL